MDIKHELMKLEHTIHELQKTQAQIRQRISFNIDRRNENTVKKIERIEGQVEKLEVEYDIQSRKLKDVSQKSLKLLDKIEALSIKIKDLRSNDCCQSDETATESLLDVPRPTAIEKCEHECLDKGLNANTSTKAPSKMKQENRPKDLVITCANVAMPAFTLNPSESRHFVKDPGYKVSSVTNNTNNLNIVDNESNHKSHLETQGLTRTITNTHEDKVSENKASHQHEKQQVNRDDTKRQNTADASSNVTLPPSINKLRRNNFGYKQRYSNMTNDNRVTFHSNLQPYEKHDPNSSSNPSRSHTRESSTASLSKKNPKRFEERLPPQTDQPKTTNEWFKFAEDTRVYASLRRNSGAIKRGRRGHDYVLVLDTSEAMRGSSITRMKSTAIQYVDGIQQIQREIGLEDNIGLAVFGGHTRLVQECTNDYELIKNQIAQLEPSGDSLLFAGLLMGLAGVHGGVGITVGDFSMQGSMIVFTDSASANNGQRSNSDGSLYRSDLHDQAEILGVVDMIASRSIKIFYVPTGNQQRYPAPISILMMHTILMEMFRTKHNPEARKFYALDCIADILEHALQKTKGKMIPPHEIYRLVRMTQVILAAVDIATDLRFSPEKHTKELVQRHMRERSRGGDDTHEDCVDLVLDLLNASNSLYTELNCSTLQLGDRVRRGPDWIYKNQDSNMAGTVVGQMSDDNICVEWDSGYRNYYVYNVWQNVITIQKVKEPRRILDDLIAVGCRVIRGPDWTYGNVDGGQGCMGTVLNLKADGTVIVRWDCKRIGCYKVGRGGLFEVKVDTGEDIHDELSATIPPGIRSTTERQNTSTFRSNEMFELLDDNMNDYIIPLNPDPKVTAVWEYEEYNTDWKKYPQEINIRIEKAFRRKSNGKTIITMKQSTYIVYFSKMVQVNQATKESVAVRRNVNTINEGATGNSE